jgi:hypothetical protein
LPPATEVTTTVNATPDKNATSHSGILIHLPVDLILEADPAFSLLRAAPTSRANHIIVIGDYAIIANASPRSSGRATEKNVPRLPQCIFVTKGLFAWQSAGWC